jgi:hypothetical protein
VSTEEIDAPTIIITINMLHQSSNAIVSATKVRALSRNHRGSVVKNKLS